MREKKRGFHPVRWIKELVKKIGPEPDFNSGWCIFCLVQLADVMYLPRLCGDS